MRILLFIAGGAMLALAGCADVNTTGAEAAMWGPCRDVALERQKEERLAGWYDAQTLKVALAWTYNDCVQGDRRVRVHSIYDGPPPAVRPPGAVTVTASSGAHSPPLLLNPQD